MRIGLDARHLTHPQEGGFKTYAQSLVDALMRVDRENDYFLFTDRTFDGLPDMPGNFRVRVVQGSLPVREQVAMPIALARDKIDVAHFLSNTAPLLVRCPFVLTIHDVIPCLPEPIPRPSSNRRARILDRYWREIIPMVAGRAAKIVTVSESSSSDIQHVLGTPSERIKVLYNGIDPAFRVLDDNVQDELLKQYNLPFRRFVMGFLSKEPRKNSAGVVAAFKLMADKTPECGLVLVSNSREDVDMLSESALRDPRIVTLRRLPREDLVAVYNAAEALIFPSYAEGFGFPIVEAMACGTPVISSNAGSLPEVAGGAAILTDPDNVRGIAQAILSVLTSQQRSQELRTLGLERSMAFSWDRTAMGLVDAYAEAAHGSDSREAPLEMTR